MAVLATRLPDRGILKLSGADALALLDRLVTIEASDIADGGAGYAALLTPQGKILTDFFLFRVGGDVFLDAPAAVTGDLLKRLTLYRLRAAVTLADVTADTAVHVLWSDDGSLPGGPAGALAAAADPRLPALGLRVLMPATGTLPAEAGTTTPADWATRRVAFGVPDSGIDFALGDAFPHDADMDDLNGVDFTKGCFVGQEVVSLLLVLPIALPGIVTGIALRSAYGVMEIPFSFWTIVIGHATFCVVVVYNNALARFRRTNQSLIEASMDLGADGFQTLRYVILPNLATALLAGGMLAFALSFDEVIVTTFTAGQQTTLPIWMLNELVRPRERPVTNVVAVLVMAVTFFPILAAYWLTREGEHVAGGSR